MLLDIRTYECHPGTINDHLALYERMGKEPQTRHLGTPVVFARTETGNPNVYVHIWVYESAGDREAKRQAMWADPDWLAYTKASKELGALKSQKNELFTPIPFMPTPLTPAGS